MSQTICEFSGKSKVVFSNKSKVMFSDKNEAILR